MNFFRFIVQDWKANTGNSKGRMVLFCFRVANFFHENPLWYYLGFIYLILYRIFIEWILGIEIPWNTRIGRNLQLYHGQGLVINSNTIIGEGCTIRHSTTIGNKKLKDGSFSLSPLIGDYVDIGSNTCIIGAITIGNHVDIGCGTIVVKDVPGNSVVKGNPGVYCSKLEQSL